MISLPWPPKELNPNHRAHRTKKAKIKSLHRHECYILACLNREKYIDAPCHLIITFCPPDKRNRDLDNLLSSCKGLLDGLADGWGVDDKNFHPITIDWGEVVKGGRVDIEIKETT